MKLVGRFVVYPWKAVQSSWLDWAPQSSGTCAVRITSGLDRGELEVSLDRRLADDVIRQHLRLAVGAGVGVQTSVFDRIDSTKVRLQLTSRSSAPVHGEIRLEDDRMA